MKIMILINFDDAVSAGPAVGTDFCKGDHAPGINDQDGNEIINISHKIAVRCILAYLNKTGNVA